MKFLLFLKQEILNEKDALIVELQAKNFALNENLIAATMDTDKASVAALSKVIKDKDKQIEELMDQIKVYVDEMEANTAIIEDMKGELQRSMYGCGQKTWNLMMTKSCCVMLGQLKSIRKKSCKIKYNNLCEKIIAVVLIFNSYRNQTFSSRVGYGEAF